MKKLMNFTYLVDKNLENKILTETKLSYKEKEFFKYFMQEKNCNEISTLMNCSLRTTQYRKREIYKKIKKFYNEEISEYELMNDYKVYVLLFPNNKVYVGSSKNLKQRWNNGLGYKNQPVLYKAIQDFGWENIKKYVIYSNLTQEEAEKKENETIVIYKSYMEEFGYNKSILY